jgi:hypothetical protein
MGRITNLMNENPEFASSWNGKILMHLEAYDEKHPSRKVQELELEDKDKGIKNMKMLAKELGMYDDNNFEIGIEFGQGISLPYKAAFKLRVHLGDITFETDAPAQSEKKGYNRWSWKMKPTVMKSKHK